MTQAQAHRGPDGAGYLLLGRSARLDFRQAPSPEAGDFLGLGHRRLAVIDTSAAGLQPMSSPDSQLWIVFNGEIYNYVELRQELQEKGIVFRTGTDTEVILAAYQVWGEGCFQRFNGMWALAIWDGRLHRLVLSRDRLGVKPLHYLQGEAGFLFASEIKGILASASLSRRANRRAVLDYLKWSVVNHDDETFFEDIRSFPAGCYAVLSSPEDHIEPRPFWSLDGAREARPLHMRDASEAFAELFRDSVRLRLRSDIAVGSCLSGGLDSSAIVCQAAALNAAAGSRINTFTAGSDEPKVDERGWAGLVNDAAGAVPHVVVPSPEAFLSQLDELIWHQEEPFVSASIFAQWLIMQEAGANNIHVVLDGQGADEILCGYRKFMPFYLVELLRAFRPDRALAETIGLVLRGDRGTWHWRDGRRYLPKVFAQGAGGIDTVLHEDMRPAWREGNLPLGPSSSVVQRQIADVRHFSLPSLLRYEDRNSMAFGVEGRLPFLDYRLVEWCVGLPSELKLSGGRTKAVLRNAVKGLVPQAIIDRRDKIGFTTAQERWMQGPLLAAFEACFSDRDFALSGLIDQAALQREFGCWREGRSRLSHSHFFRIFVLARWARRMGAGI